MSALHSLVSPKTSLLAAGLLDGCMTWLSGNVDFFDPFKDGELSGLCEIPLSELAILTLCALRSGVRIDQHIIARFLDLLESSYTEPSYEERPFREPEALVSHLIVHAALWQSGRLKSRAWHTAAERLVRHGTLTAPSLPPHRMMELRHALDLAGVCHDMPPYHALFEATIAARPLNPIFVSKPEAYILTHVLFYASDLGAREPLGIDAANRVRLEATLERLLAMHVAAGDWDLAAEFVFSSQCLRRPNCYLDVAMEYLIRAQRPSGAVPGTRATSVATPDGSGSVNDQQDISAFYHTTLVSALAAISLQDVS